MQILEYFILTLSWYAYGHLFSFHSLLEHDVACPSHAGTLCHNYGIWELGVYAHFSCVRSDHL